MDKHITLCQKCLRQVDLDNQSILFNADTEKPSGNALCVCGGDVCDCHHCIETLVLLKEGVLDKNQLGLQIEIASWSKETGANK